MTCQAIGNKCVFSKSSIHNYNDVGDYELHCHFVDNKVDDFEIGLDIAKMIPILVTSSGCVGDVDN